MSGRTVIQTLRILLSLVLSALLVGAGVGYFLNQPTPRVLKEEADFRVPSGSSAAAIADRLGREELIRSEVMLRLLSRVLGTESAFKSGVYSIERGSTTLAIHDLLVSGQQRGLRVTIPEGYTVGRIGERLEEAGVTTVAEVEKAAASPALLERFGIPGTTVEGYLFPDTYYFPPEHEAQAVLATMIEAFFRNLEQVVPDWRQWDRRALHEHIILASIVEREYRVAAEAPTIASVFKNRLEYNIGLESCATIAYIITEIKGLPHPEFITSADTELESDFNTYKWAGLPPGPISNPGLVALRATFHAPETDYYYFVLKDPSTGEHYFSKDLGEHNQAKHIYLKSVQ